MKQRTWKRAPKKREKQREEWESAPTIECFIKMSNTKEYGKGNITSTKIILDRRTVVGVGWECQNNLIYSNLKWLSRICSAASKQPYLTKIQNCGKKTSEIFIIEWPSAHWLPLLYSVIKLYILLLLQLASSPGKTIPIVSAQPLFHHSLSPWKSGHFGKCH